MWKNKYISRAGALLAVPMLLAGSACVDSSKKQQPDAGVVPPRPDASIPAATVYTNPLKIRIQGGGLVENCPDPAIIRGQTPGDRYWYLYCTSNPLNSEDTNEEGETNYHLITMHRSEDLVNWVYLGDAFDAQPAWAAAPQGFWAPDIQFFNGKYHLYYSSSDTTDSGASGHIGAAAIGVATSDSPSGPWTHAEAPVVEPQKAPCCQGETETRMRWVIDSNVVTDDDGQRYIYFGSYFGGIAVRKLSEDGLTSDPESQLEIVSDERYEAAYVVKRDGYYYMFVSATNCCNGILTGYSIFVGRSESPTGPFVDREGVPFLPVRVGGTPVMSMNGNRWVGAGHNAVFTDFAGQDWVVYHAIDRTDAYRGDGPVGDFSEKRPVLMDPLDWIDGWPTVRGGHWASDTEQPGPAAQPGQESNYTLQVKPHDEPGALIDALSDEFDGAALGAQWTWTREPAADTFALEAGSFRFDTQQADLHQDSNSAALLSVPVPAGKNYMVETKVTLNVPVEPTCCPNFTQAGLVIHGDDDNYVKLTHASIWDTRQIEFAKELGPVPANHPRYGNTVGGPPGETTWLRIVAHVVGGDEERYTAYSSLDGTTWYRNGTWTHSLGQDAKIALVSMGRTPETTDVHVASFDYVHVYELAE